MNNIQIFNNPEFGDIRTVVIDNEPWFVGKDVADILGYQNGSRDINRHVDEEDKQLTKMVLRWTYRYFRWKPTALRKLSERKAFQSWEENSRAHTAIVDYAKRFTTTCMLI